MNTDDAKFHVVFQYEKTIDDVVIVGIFTRQADADVMVIDLRQAGRSRPNRIEMTMRAIKEFLVQQRYGKIGHALDRVEALHDQISGI